MLCVLIVLKNTFPNKNMSGLLRIEPNYDAIYRSDIYGEIRKKRYVRKA